LFIRTDIQKHIDGFNNSIVYRNRSVSYGWNCL